MRTLFVVLLAFAVTAAPAAQASACRCVEQTAAQEPACCCGEAGPCDCCGGEEEQAINRCPCVQTSPLAQEAPTIDLPAPAAAPAAPLALPPEACILPSVRATAETRDPTPDVSLPLLI